MAKTFTAQNFSERLANAIIADIPCAHFDVVERMPFTNILGEPSALVRTRAGHEYFVTVIVRRA